MDGWMSCRLYLSYINNDLENIRPSTKLLWNMKWPDYKQWCRDIYIFWSTPSHDIVDSLAQVNSGCSRVIMCHYNGKELQHDNLFGRSSNYVHIIMCFQVIIPEHDNVHYKYYHHVTISISLFLKTHILIQFKSWNCHSARASLVCRPTNPLVVPFASTNVTLATFNPTFRLVADIEPLTCPWVLTALVTALVSRNRRWYRKGSTSLVVDSVTGFGNVDSISPYENRL